MVTSLQGGIKSVRKHLGADALNALVRMAFRKVSDARQAGCSIPIDDALMSAFATEPNLHQVYGVDQIPCDTQMRAILDPIDPEQIRPVFGDVFRELQRGKVLESFVFYEGCYLLVLDGTGYFSSPTIHCESCLEKVNRQTGERTYQHQMLGAAIVHPAHREVIPLAVNATPPNVCFERFVRNILA
jgi:hypothetical protein